MSGQLAPVWTPGGTMTDPASDTGDLWRWVDRLTRDRRQRLVRKPPGGKTRVEYVDVPSLWTQLVDAEASNNTGGVVTSVEGPITAVVGALLPVVEAECRRRAAEELRDGAAEWREVDADEWRPVIAWLLARADAIEGRP